MTTDIPLGLTFDDILLVPQYSDIASRKDVSLKTKLTKNIELHIPLISSNMDTVTESRMAIEMAMNGSIGIIHRYCSIEEQVEMVRKVKRAESCIITDPYTINPNATIKEVKELAKTKNVNSFLVTNSDSIAIGILTSRDIKGREDNELVRDCMTGNLITSPVGISMDEAQRTMLKKRIQKLPLINPDGTIYGLICLKDIERTQNRPYATVDSQGRLRCGAAVGVKENDMERVRKLIEVGVDVIVIDIAHGHSFHCISMLKKIKALYPHSEIIAGNVATAEGALDLIMAGADAVKVSVGSGSICTTRLQSGSGYPLFSSLMAVAPICKLYNVPLISDGGNRNSGNMAKALAIGANTIMLGRILAGSDPSPGKVMIKNGKRVKIIRGMAGLSANISNAKRQGLPEPDPLNFAAEGVEGYVPYSGPLIDTLNQLLAGIRSGMSYSGARNIQELQAKAKFVRITHSGSIESGVHDISQI